jgi:hypothetical protein
MVAAALAAGVSLFVRKVLTCVLVMPNNEDRLRPRSRQIGGPERGSVLGYGRMLERRRRRRAVQHDRRDVGVDLALPQGLREVGRIGRQSCREVIRRLGQPYPGMHDPQMVSVVLQNIPPPIPLNGRFDRFG